MGDILPNMYESIEIRGHGRCHVETRWQTGSGGVMDTYWERMEGKGVKP